MELILKRLALNDLLLSERRHLEEISSLTADSLNDNPFSFHNYRDNQETHIAQTQRILANIQRQNLEDESHILDDEQNEIKGTKRKHNFVYSREPKRTKACSNTENEKDSVYIHDIETDNPAITKTNVLEFNESTEELPSHLGSPVITSTHKAKESPSVKTKLAVFQFSENNSDEDDTIFDL